MNDVVWLSVDPEIPPDSYWDQTLIKELLKGSKHHYDMGELKEAIVIIPGAYQGKHIDKINTELAKLDKCKVIVTSDEENNFPIDELSHENMKVYASYCNPKYTSEITWLPIGPAKIIEGEYKAKDLSWFFAGQVNHDSRRRLVDVLERLTGGQLIKSGGFAQGIDQDEYLSVMDRAKAVPAPRGNRSPDSFRLYEALEHGAVPIAEDKAYWPNIFGFEASPLPVLDKWEDISHEINKADDVAYRNKLVAWWHRYKLDLKDELLGNPEGITVVVPVSPIKSHPSTEIIDETIDSIRHQLPDSRIVVTFDGVRHEQLDKSADYQEFIARFLAKYNNQNIYPVIFDKHTHQVGMMRAVLDLCSEYIVYVEQDTPFTKDYIDWEGCKKSIGMVDLIRFHFEAFIPQPHEYLMKGMVKRSPVRLLRTLQWSQRPQLTTKEFYRKVLSNFSENAISFIEDYMHSIAQDYPVQYKLAIYYPRGSIKRTYHLDGRAGGEKWDDRQVF